MFVKSIQKKRWHSMSKLFPIFRSASAGNTRPWLPISLWLCIAHIMPVPRSIPDHSKVWSKWTHLQSVLYTSTCSTRQCRGLCSLCNILWKFKRMWQHTDVHLCRRHTVHYSRNLLRRSSRSSTNTTKRYLQVAQQMAYEVATLANPLISPVRVLIIPKYP